MKYFHLIFILLLIPLLLNTCSPDQKMLPENNWIISVGSRPLVISHGGAKLLWPENSVMAFDSSVAMGCNVLEMDLRLTKDSILVTHHDETIDNTSDKTGKVADYSLAELKQFNFGFQFKDLNENYPYKTTPVEISTLEELFIKYNFMKMIIEIKDEGEWGKAAADELKYLILKFDMASKVIVASFHDEITKYFVEISNVEIPVSAGEKEATKFVLTSKSLTGFAYRPKTVAYQLPLSQSVLKIGTKRVINSAHNHNMAIHFWTINDKEEMRNLIEKGADGIITDRPDILNELLLEMGF